jgi:hypothetical protein
MSSPSNLRVPPVPWRVAPVPRKRNEFPYKSEGAPGPSQLGTGEVRLNHPCGDPSTPNACVAAYTAETRTSARAFNWHL